MITKFQSTIRSRTMLFVLLLCASLTAHAQIKITGKTTDPKGESSLLVNVLVKGTTVGVITDPDGGYAITIPATVKNPVLLFSSLGYKDQEVVVGTQSVINITMESGINQLDEVVVVSYGTQKKRELTGSVSQIKASDMENMPVAQLGQKLAGQVAGVQVTQATGRPGESPIFRIRGAASFNGGSQPLFVIDGLPTSSGLSTINPDEIESFSVLKDAAATSLYGSRAANGVVLVTTKRGKSGKTTVNFNAYYGVQSISGLKEPDVMNAREFTQYMKERYEDKALYEGYTGGVPAEYQNPEQYGEGTNWYKELTRSAAIQNYSLSITAGKDKFNTAITLGYFNQEGILLGSGYQRFSLRANSDYQVNDKIRIGLNIAPAFQIANGENVDNHRNILSSAISAFPHISPYDANGNLVMVLKAAGQLFSTGTPNWKRVLEERTNTNKTAALLSNVFMEVDIWKGIKYKIQAGAELHSANYRTFTPSTVSGGWTAGPPRPATGSYNTAFTYDWNLENMLTYTKTIGDHNFDLLAGYSAQKNRREDSQMNGKDFPDDEVEWLNAAATITRGGDRAVDMKEWSVASMIGRLNYSYKGRYLFQATIRRDGSSRFGADSKYANFPSLSAGWIASDESFMEPVKSVMNYLKVRASYGTTGNFNIDNYTHLATIVDKNYIFGGTLASGKGMSTLGNRNLTWEETTQTNIGVDLGFLNDRIFVMYDYYKKKTTGMLYQVDIPYASGFDNVQSNMGELDSHGHEITIASRNMVGEFKWTTNLNIGFNRNKITKLGTNNTRVNRGDNALIVGQPVGVLWGHLFDGVYMNQAEFDAAPKHKNSVVGATRLKDMGSDPTGAFKGAPDGVIDIWDQVVMGDPNPDFTYGVTNEFSYKGFDLSIMFTGQVGGDVMNYNYTDQENLDGIFNVRKYVKDRWRSEANPGNGIVPRTKAGSTEEFRNPNSHQVYDASYLAIRNVTLGYTIPFQQNQYISKLRLYASVQQLAVFSKYEGINPEIARNTGWEGMGVDASTYPTPRVFSFGCNVTF